MNDTSTSVFTEFFELRSFIVQFDGEDYVQPHVRIIHTHTLTKKKQTFNDVQVSRQKKKKSLGTKKFRVKCKWNANVFHVLRCVGRPFWKR